MKTTKIRIISVAILVALVAVWAYLLNAFSSNYIELFPGNSYETYALSDDVAGGFSTSEISVREDAVSARVNIRSGMAYPYAGVGLNLMSVDRRPAQARFDFSKYDTICVVASAVRMRSLMLRIMTDDAEFTREGDYLSYRPLLAPVSVSATRSEIKVPLSSFKVPERWLVLHGLDHDDGHAYWDRGLLFEISNGEGALRGIPDEFEVSSIRMYGENRSFKNAMYVVLALIVFAFVAAMLFSGREASKKGCSENGKSGKSGQRQNGKKPLVNRRENG